MANGQFPVTYDVAAEGTAVAHDDINELILVAELERFKGAFGELKEGWSNRSFFEGQPLKEPFSKFLDKEEDYSKIDATKFAKMVRQELGKLAEGERSGTYYGARGDKDWRRDPLTENIHMPSYGKFLDIAMEGVVPSHMEDEPGFYKAINERFGSEIENIGRKWNRETRKMEGPGPTAGEKDYIMGKFYDIVQQYQRAASVMQGGDPYFRGGPTIAATFGGKKFGISKNTDIGEYEDTSEKMLNWTNKARANEDTIRIWNEALYGNRFRSDTGERLKEDRVEALRKRGILTGDEWSKTKYRKDYSELLRTLLHEPPHYPGAIMGHPSPERNVYRRQSLEKIRASEGYRPHYPLQLFNDVTRALGANLRTKYSRKDINAILEDLIYGEEIDFGKYKRLDIGGK